MTMAAIGDRKAACGGVRRVTNRRPDTSGVEYPNPVVRRPLIAFAISTVAACGGSAPAPPVVTPPPGTQTINGTERIGWDQPAADAVDLATIRYAFYVDGTRTEAAGVTCAAASTAAGFACTARLPTLSPGAHSLQIASFVDAGGVLESARSAALQVTVTASTTSAAPARADTAARAREQPGAARSRDGVAAPALETALVADGVDDPTDLAFAPDGRLFVAERAGQVRIVRDGRLIADPALPPRVLGDGAQLLALAVDPDFARTRQVFAVYASRDATFTLARFREAADTLADAAVLLDRIPSGSPPHASVRFGADGKLYAAFDAAGDARRAGEAAALNGKMLRMNADGTTPREQRAPAVADGLFAPAAFDWNAANGALWIADAAPNGRPQLRTASGDQRHALPAGAAPSSIAFASGDLWIASADSADLLRVRFDRDSGATPTSVERVPTGADGGIHAIALGSDGRLYLATGSRVVSVRQ